MPPVSRPDGKQHGIRRDERDSRGATCDRPQGEHDLQGSETATGDHDVPDAPGRIKSGHNALTMKPTSGAHKRAFPSSSPENLRIPGQLSFTPPVAIEDRLARRPLRRSRRLDGGCGGRRRGLVKSNLVGVAFLPLSRTLEAVRTFPLPTASHSPRRRCWRVSCTLIVWPTSVAVSV